MWGGCFSCAVPDLWAQPQCLYPVVTGCEEMDWSHVSTSSTLQSQIPGGGGREVCVCVCCNECGCVCVS